MNYPDNIYAIGGAGKEIAFTILESSWLIDELLKPQPNPTSLTVRILDTAEGEQNNDQQRVRKLRQRINEKKEEYRDQRSGPNESIGDITLKYKVLTENVYLASAIDLVGEDKVRNITNGKGMTIENWWLNEDNIDETLDFARGVVRQRGLGKGVYYKAYAEDDQISSIIDLPDRGRVAMLVGLGGGTGSGILLDIARDLKERQRTAELTLFGILPNHTEGIEENTNAFAALSELEYNALKGNSIFNDRVLIPIDPTNFDGKAGNRIQTDDELEELDEAMVYLLASYYNTTQANMEDPFAGNPDYAPFTIGIPQVLRYNVDDVNDARDELDEALDTQRDALEAERAIYERVGAFMDRQFDVPDESDAVLRDSDTTFLNSRLEAIQSWLEYELFQELEYQSVQAFDEIISDARDQGETIEEQIDIIDSSLRAVDPTTSETTTFVDTIDEQLADIFESELELLSRRMEILKQRNAIDDSDVRNTIEYLIGASDTGATAGVRLSRLESRLDDNRDDLKKFEEDLKEAEATLEERREEQSSQVERRTSQWLRDIDGELTQLRVLEITDVQDAAGTLNQNLASFRRKVDNAEHEEEIDGVDQTPVLEALQSFQGALEPLNQDLTDLEQDVRDSLDEYKQVRKAYLRMQEDDGGLLDRIPGIGGNTEERRNEAIKDFRYSRSQLNNMGIFQVDQPAGGFQSSVEFSPDSYVQQARDEVARLQESVVDTLSRQVETIPNEIQRQLDRTLNEEKPDKDTIQDLARDAFEEDIIETEDLEKEIDDYQSQIARLEDDIEMQEDLLDTFQTTNNKRSVWEESREKFNETLGEHEQDSNRTFTTASEDYVYVKNIKPNDIFRATGSDDIADSDLFSSDQERRRVNDNLEELVENAQNQQYTGLQRRKLSHGNERYSGQRVRFAAMSRAINQLGSEELGFKDTFQVAFDIDEGGRRVADPYSSWTVDAGGDWDIGVSVFITGVFLDNIRKVTQAGGYRDGYERSQDDQGTEILIHHAFGLDEGYYVRRNKLYNMEASEDIGFFVQEDADITAKLLNDHYDIIKHSDDAQLPDDIVPRPADD